MKFEVKGPIWPEFEFIRDFMAVLVICKFEDGSIKRGDAVLRTTFSPLSVYGKMFRCSRASISKVNGPIRSEIELVRDFMDVLSLPLSTWKIRSKIKSLSIEQHFPHCKSVGANFSSLKGK